jgi:hypothetical protein
VHNKGGIKAIMKAKDGMVYLSHNTEPLIKMQTLHFQGETKIHMKRHLFTRSISLDLLYYSNEVLILFQKVWKKLFGH